tara:strand:+ start:157 stop:423 length:267 start_codon:yes stop_codon:yes gene_type:complete
MTDRQRFLNFIKQQYPVGSVVINSSCSQPYTVNKRTVFRVHPMKSEDYNDMFRPEDENDYRVDFTCHNPGINTRDYNLKSYTRKEILT